jgi:hypothetical protein
MLLYLQERRLRTAYVGNLPLNVTEAQVKEVWTFVHDGFDKPVHSRMLA